MNDRLARLTRLKGWLDAFRPLPPAVVEELAERYDVRLTYHFTALEGNTHTESETQMVLEKGITVAGKRLAEHLEVIGHREALTLVRDLADGNPGHGARHARSSRPRRAGSGLCRGRSVPDLDAMAAGTEYRYPSHLKVAEMMHDFVAALAVPSDSHPIIGAADAHLEFVTIHPFRDGNGRVGRLLMNLLLLQTGYPIAVIPFERRAAYFDALVAAQQGGKREPLRTLVADAVEASLTDTLRTLATAADARADEKPFYPALSQELART